MYMHATHIPKEAEIVHTQKLQNSRTHAHSFTQNQMYTLTHTHQTEAEIVHTHYLNEMYLLDNKTEEAFCTCH